MTTGAEKRQIANAQGLVNVAAMWGAAEVEEVPFSVACALFQKESNGRNVYGHDQGGALAGFPLEVNEHNFAVFLWLVFDKGQQSNGVGPAQITYKGFLTDMDDQGLRPWVAYDNMRYGLRLIGRYRKETGSWEAAGTRYNGSPAYGVDFAKRVDEWVRRFR